MSKKGSEKNTRAKAKHSKLMAQKKRYKATIGIVLSTVPQYSETFFRNKIKGLEKNNMDVTLFLDTPFFKASDLPCKVVFAPNFNTTLFSF